MTRMMPGQRTFAGLSVLGLVLFAAAPLWIAQAPYESTMGLIQKIFYFHVPGWMVMFLAVAVCGAASAVHLFRAGRRPIGWRPPRPRWRWCSASSV